MALTGAGRLFLSRVGLLTGVLGIGGPHRVKGALEVGWLLAGLHLGADQGGIDRGRWVHCDAVLKKVPLVGSNAKGGLEECSDPGPRPVSAPRTEAEPPGSCFSTVDRAQGHELGCSVLIFVMQMIP